MSKLTKMILIILILFLSNTSFASDFTYGLKIGGTYSNADIKYNLEGSEYRFNDNYSFGTFFSFYGYTEIHSFLNLQLELIVNQKGFTYENDEIGLQNDKLFSLDFATLLKFNIKIASLYIGGFSSITASEDSPLNLGYILGLESKYKKILIDFRYNQGFNNFAGTVRSSISTYYDNSRQFVLSLGYEF
jgi:hypothetical protein